MTKIGVYSLPFPIVCGLILSLAALPIAVQSAGQLDEACNSTSPTCEGLDASCVDDVCVCNETTYPKLPDRDSCKALEHISLTISSFTSTNVSLSWTSNVFPSGSLIRYNVSCAAVNISQAPVLHYIETNSTTVIGLHAGHLYEIVVVAVYNDSFIVSEETRTYVLLRPKHPTGWNVKPINTTSLLLTWNATSADKGTFLRVKADVSTSQEIEVPVRNAELTVSGLSPGTKVDLSIDAVIVRETPENVKMNASSTTPVVMTGFTMPAAPSSVSISNLTSISFKAVISPGSGSVDHYRYVLSELSTGKLVTENTTSNESVLFTGLSPFTQYTLSVAAFYNGFNSANVTQNVTTRESAPGIPQNLIVVADSLKGGVVVSWRPPLLSNGILKNYELQWVRTYPSDLNKTMGCGLNLNKTLDVTEAPPGSKHCFKVRVINSAQFSDWSNDQCLQLDDGNASKPNLSVVWVGSNAVNLSWSPPDSPNGRILCYYVLTQERDEYSGAVKTGCKSAVRLEASASNCTSTLTSTGLSKLNSRLDKICGSHTISLESQELSNALRIENLQISTLYRTSVFAVNRAGPGETASDDILTKQTRSSEVASIEIHNITNRSFIVIVAPPSKSNGVVMEYLVKVTSNHTGVNITECYSSRCSNCTARKDFVNRTTDGDAELSKLTSNCSVSNSTFSENSGTIRVKVENLDPFVFYTATVWPVNSVGPGRKDSKGDRTLPDLPGPVRNLQVSNASQSHPTTLRVEWIEPARENGQISHYFLRFESRSSSSYNHVQELQVSSNTTSKDVVLKACGQYYVTVVAQNQVGNSSKAESGTGYTRATVPVAPKAPQLFVISTSSLTANWSKVECGFCGVSYQVYLNKSDTSYLENITNRSSIRFQNLNPFTLYWANLKARAGPDLFGGYSNWSSPSPDSPPVTTKESAPGPVENLNCSQPPGKYNEIKCMWAKPVITNGHIVGYLVSHSVQGRTRETDTTKLTVTLTDNVRPDEIIIVNVRAKTSVGAGSERNVSIVLASGPPALSMNETQVEQSLKDKMNKPAPDQPSTQIRLTVPCTIFNPNHGDITNLSVIVRVNSQTSNPIVHSEKGRVNTDVSTWTKTEKGKLGPYAVTLPKCHINDRRRRKRSIQSSSIVLGVGNCDSNPDCNGPLLPDTEYQLAIRGYTAGGSRTVGFVLKKTDAQTNWSLIIPIILISLLALGAIPLAVFLIRRKRRLIKRTRPRKDTFPPSSRGSFVHLDGDRGDGTELNDLSPVPSTASELAWQAATGAESSVPLDIFPLFVQEMNRDCRLLYTDAFNEVKKRALKTEQEQDLRTEEAAMQSNRLKNRFANILPFDHTRVCLNSDDDPTSGMDYINANYISGHKRRREFIACQGPLSQTIDDFWRMIWEQNVSLIVMLTLCVERGRNKCEQYWPQEEETRVYGDIAVRLYTQSTMMPYTLRILDLMCGSESRRVTHLQMLTWEDFTAPNLDHLTALMDAFRSNLPAPGFGDEAATVVHCSAGVGRTGTFIALDRLINAVDSGSDAVDINGVILSLRAQRRYMVQSEAQYIFIHDFMLHYLKQKRRMAETSLTDIPTVAVKTSENGVTPNGSVGQMDAVFANNAFRDDLP